MIKSWHAGDNCYRGGLCPHFHFSEAEKVVNITYELAVAMTASAHINKYKGLPKLYVNAINLWSNCKGLGTFKKSVEYINWLSSTFLIVCFHVTVQGCSRSLCTLDTLQLTHVSLWPNELHSLGAPKIIVGSPSANWSRVNFQTHHHGRGLAGSWPTGRRTDGFGRLHPGSRNWLCVRGLSGE